MDLIIIAKYYPPYYNGARGIQMSRVVDALANNTDLSISVITAGRTDSIINKKKNLTIHTVDYKYYSGLFWNLFKRLFGDTEFISKNKFVVKATAIANGLILKNKDAIIFTASTPFDSHIVGYNIKARYTSINWIAYLSDAWPLSLAPKPYKRTPILSLFLLKYTSKTLKSASGIIAPNREILDLCTERQNVSKSVKKHVVTHCGINSILHHNNSNGDYIVHSGYFSKERVFKELFIALKNISDKKPEFKGLVQIGNVCAKFKLYAKKYNCEHLITYKIASNSEEAIKIQSEYFIGIIVEAKMNRSIFTPSKLAEYPFVNQKIVIITPANSPASKSFSGEKCIYLAGHDEFIIEEKLIDALNESNCTGIKKTTDYFTPDKIAQNYMTIFKGFDTKKPLKV